MVSKTSHKIILITFFPLLVTTKANAQSFFSVDGKGSAIQIADGVMRFQATDKSVTLTSLSIKESTSMNGSTEIGHKVRRGYSVTANAKNNIGTVLNKDGLSQDGEISFFFGSGNWKLNQPNKMTIITGQATFKSAKYNVLNPGDTVFTKQNFNAARLGLFFEMPQITPSSAFGASVQIETSNNYNTLKDATIVETNVLSNVGGLQKVLQTTTTGKQGEYKTFFSVPVSVDYLSYMKDGICIDYFLRSDLRQNSSQSTVGAGLFFSGQGKPTEPLFGIVGRYSNTDRGTLSLIAGFNIK